MTVQQLQLLITRENKNRLLQFNQETKRKSNENDENNERALSNNRAYRGVEFGFGGDGEARREGQVKDESSSCHILSLAA